MDQDIFSGGGRGEYLDLERVVAFYTGSYFYLQPHNREREGQREREREDVHCTHCWDYF